MKKKFDRNAWRRIHPARRLALTLSVILALIVPVPGQERPPRQAEEGRTLGPLEKSLLLPGWGQLSEKRYLEGILFLAGEAAALAGFFVNDHLGNENYALYRGAETMEDALRTRRLTEKHDARRNQFLVAAAAVWAANLLDISLIVKTKDGTKESFSLRICCEAKDHIGVTAHCRF